jgi:hypothetical protein
MTFPLIVADGTWVDANGDSYTGIGSWFQWTSPNATPTYTWSFDLDASGNLTIGRYDGSGTLIDSPISIDATSGIIAMATLPTSDPQIAGALWNNNQVLTVSSAGTAVTPGAPVNTVAPAVSGTAAVGSTLSSTSGGWTSSSTPTYTYQWLRNGLDIQGAISPTYGTVSADTGTLVSCKVTSTNTAGSASATSNGLSISANVPLNTVAPVISGNGIVGSTLSCTNGTWTNSPTSYTYLWDGDGSVVNGPTYVCVTSDAGSGVSCAVTAINSSGSSAAQSKAISIAPAVPGAPVNTVAPVASGSGEVGDRLNCTTGTWTHYPYSYQYLWNGAGTAHGSTYVPVSADSGNSVYCTVTAINNNASTSAVSNPIAIA